MTDTTAGDARRSALMLGARNLGRAIMEAVAILLGKYAPPVSALDYDRATLDPRDLSYARQLAYLVEEGWELEEAGAGESLRYLRRHRRIEEIRQTFKESGQRLVFAREDDGTWRALVLSGSIQGDPTTTPSISGTTPLEAAETALEQLKAGD